MSCEGLKCCVSTLLPGGMAALLLCQCSTPKGGEFIDGEWSSMPVLAEVGHLGRATVGSLLHSPTLTLRTSAAIIFQRTRALITGNVPLPRITLSDQAIPAPGSESFEEFLDHQKKLPRRTLGTVKYFVDGDAFFPEFLGAIRNAKQSIKSQVFIFDNDEVGVQVADALKARAEEIPVRVLFDSLGTRIAHRIPPDTAPQPGFVPPKDMGSYLRRHSHARVHGTTNPAFMIDHTKVHVFDGSIAYLGGMNLGREYRSEWHDMMARVEGPVVKDLAGVFDLHWREQSWLKNWTLQNVFERRPWSESHPESLASPPAGSFPLRVLRTDIARGRVEIARALQLAIRGARHRVWVETPYISEDGFTDALMEAARRGVDVRLILPGKNESGIMQQANFAAASSLIRSGVKVLKYPGMTHLKAAICDGWATFGSANCDTLSLRINRELNLAFSDPKAVKNLEQTVFTPDFRRSSPLSVAEADREGSAFMEAVGDQL